MDAPARRAPLPRPYRGGVAVLLPFTALRPPPDLADRVAALPYDVMDVAEARAMAAGNECSFLHVSRPEIDLPADVDPHADEVYEQGRRNLEQFVRQGWLAADPGATYSVYRQRMGDHVQTGIVGVAAVTDYESGAIAKHEHTRPDKELDRVRHIDTLGAQDEPVFLLYDRDAGIQAVIDRVVAGPADVHFVSDDGIEHTLWVVADAREIDRIREGFAHVRRLYVADGHHRSAAAARVRALRRERAAGTEGEQAHDSFLVVAFAGDDLQVLPYHRIVTDLAARSVDELLAGLAASFDVTAAAGPPEPTSRHVIGMCLPAGPAGTAWFRLELRAGVVDEDDPVQRLDVAVLQDLVLAPLLGIGDPRTDARLRFVGGVRGTVELERLVGSGEAAVAFALHPTAVADLQALADDGMIMPPKSTWFEPKLRSGLFVHSLDD